MNTFGNIASPATLNRSIAKTFLWMTIGLVVTGITSIVCLVTGLWYTILTTVPSLVILLVQLGIVIWFSASMRTASPTKLKTLFMLYAVSLGVTLTPISLAYSSGLIAMAFFITAIYFGLLTIVGFTTKKDLSKMGTLCFVGLLTMVITQLVMMLFRFNMETRLFSVIGLLLFTGITAWDMQRMKVGLANTDGVIQEKFSIYMAFEIYLDFINIFLYVLRLLGLGSNQD